VANVLSWQTAAGLWPKNTDTAGTACQRQPEELRGTFDNGASLGELRLLARAIRATGEARARAAFRRGFEAVLKAQYPSGGWPQTFPPGPGYDRHITFNDDAMVRILRFLREIDRGQGYEFLGDQERHLAAAAFDRGVQCILRCQVVMGGRRTAWCAQHDAVTGEPRPARSYELVSLSGAESAGILRLLMELEPPTAEVQRAIQAGVDWYIRTQIRGWRQVMKDGDKRLLPDAAAPPLWARFYELGTDRPMFSGRDGVKKYSLAEIEAERRNGYAWYGHWGQAVLEAYPRWQARWAESSP
jgi:pectate lyase